MTPAELSKWARSRERWAQKKLGPLPEVIHSQLGPVPVVLIERLRNKPLKRRGHRLFGKFDRRRRVIFIDTRASLLQQWQALEHERVHLHMFDAGVSPLLHHDDEEALCDALATQRIMERLHG